MADALVTSARVHAPSVLAQLLLAALVDVFASLVGGGWSVALRALAPKASHGVAADSVGAHTILGAFIDVDTRGHASGLVGKSIVAVAHV